MAADENELGPIDILVIGFPAGAPMTGDAIPRFIELVDRGIIMVYDVRIVRRQPDGTSVGVDPADLDPDAAGDLASFAGAATGLLSDDDVELIAHEIEPGGAAVAIVYENRWAAPFVTAVRRNGGILIASERVRVHDLIDALDAAETAV